MELKPCHAPGYKHGACVRNPKLYSVWTTMMHRCYDEKRTKYKDYGGRGIKVCEEWHNPNCFITWAETHGWAEGLSLDRIDNSKGYSPENCRWATPREQGNNRTTNIPYEFNGEAHTINEWARIVGINPDTLWSRIHKSNWTFEKAITTPANRKYSRKLDGERRTDGKSDRC